MSWRQMPLFLRIAATKLVPIIPRTITPGTQPITVARRNHVMIRCKTVEMSA